MKPLLDTTYGAGFHLCKGDGEKCKTKKSMISSDNITNSQIILTVRLVE
jgi:hypothetical protein